MASSGEPGHESTSPATADLDIDQPNTARMYDYYLGGGNNFAADRRMAKQVLELFPARELAVRARRWLRYAVEELVVRRGIDQFVDLGSGLPSAGSTHEVAHAHNPAARVVYVDNEPIATMHSKRLTEGLAGVGVLAADFTDPEAVLNAPLYRELVDPERPTALIFSMALHLMTDEQDPWGLVERYQRPMPRGSYLAISHATDENRPELRTVSEMYRDATNPLIVRGREEIARMFGDWEVCEPGVVQSGFWRPEEDGIAYEDAIRSAAYVGIARKL